MLITAYQQILSCMKGKHPLNQLTLNWPITRRSTLLYRFPHAKLIYLLHFTAEHYAAFYPHSMNTSGLQASALCSVPDCPHCEEQCACLTHLHWMFKLTCFTSQFIRAFKLILFYHGHTPAMIPSAVLRATNRICTFYKQCTKLLSDLAKIKPMDLQVKSL